MTALAASTDVEALLGRDLTTTEGAKVDAILTLVSDLFRREAQQDFTVGSSTVRLKVDGQRVYLQQRPVTSITSVVDDDGDAVTYTQRGQVLEVELASNKFVTVTYAHGSATVEDVVKYRVADIVRKVLLIPDDAAMGVSQGSTTTGPYTDSQTYAKWAVGGQVMLSPDDIKFARSLRVKVPRVWVTPS